MVNVNINQELLNTISNILSQQQTQLQDQIQTQSQQQEQSLIAQLQLQLIQINEQIANLQQQQEQQQHIIVGPGGGDGTGGGGGFDSSFFPIHVKSDGTWWKDLPPNTAGPWQKDDKFIPDIVRDWKDEEQEEIIAESADTTEGAWVDGFNTRERVGGDYGVTGIPGSGDGTSGTGSGNGGEMER